jgi:molybdopterin converting factor small subunit
MEIGVRFTGALRSLAGRSGLSLSVEAGATVRDALLALGEALPSAFTEQVVLPLMGGDPPLSLLLVNRRHLPGPEGLDSALEDGDVIAFVTPMEGG